MHIDPKTHTLDTAELSPSVNFDDRPDNLCLDTIVIHNISLPPAQFGGPYIEDLFLNRLDPTVHPYFEDIADRRVSAHVLIRRDGSIKQFVPFDKRAWHAGESDYQGRSGFNDFSIGIELEGSDEIPYEECQYEQLSEVIDCLCRHYTDLSPSQLVGHNQISPGRKTDPGPAFNWAHLRGLLDSLQED